MTVLKVVTAEPLADPALSVVGVGAGEGGLEAFEQMVQALPPDTGMAFVFVQHEESTDVDTRSAILTRTSAMPVVQVRGERSLEPNHVYIVPSAHDVVIEAGVLKVLPCDEGAPTSAPVDCFLQSLAKTHRDRAIGILLSGTGHDGTSGLEAIRAGGGFTFAQDESARHDGMSGSAIAAGCVDFILPPGRIAEELQRIGEHSGVAFPLSASARVPFGRPRRLPSSDGGGVDAQHEADRLVLANYTRPGVLVNADLEILQFRGDTSRYLTPAPGRPSNNLLRMARKGMLVELGATVQKALATGTAVSKEGICVNAYGSSYDVDLDVLPIQIGTPGQLFLLVMFEERKQSGRHGTRTASGKETPELANRRKEQRQVPRLMRELATTRDYLQSVINELETANDSLQSANEEVLSASEELQGINEELQSSREEIQSSNDQPSKLNEEMRLRNGLLDQVNNDRGPPRPAPRAHLPGSWQDDHQLQPAGGGAVGTRAPAG